MNAPATPAFTEAQVQAVLAKMREFEDSYLSNPVTGFNNPFRRPGLLASDIAFDCGLLKEGQTRSGRQKVDTPAARRLMKQMLNEGLIESTGSHRTMACGSTPTECFALKGFGDRLQSAREAWEAKREDLVLPDPNPPPRPRG
jgi:hypothetical protein